ncbi:MAG: phosphatase PAP2 family protein [Chitinophagia bacterium]|nr:phosphatase PAP2 family protein [Chitinophagia bacterium]
MLNQAPILYQRASNLTILVGLLLIAVSAYLGRIPVFLFLNTDGGAFMDQFFKWTTWGAEGWVWIPYLIVLVTWFKKDIKLIVLNFLLSTLITQISKHVIWDDITRPILSGIPLNQIHTVPGQVTHAYNSFPSGHTATAFTLFLLTVYLFPTKWVFAVGVIYAIICAYSRVYLGQHFPMDLGGGMLVAVLSMQLSMHTISLL